jgi:hypothetical protein
VYTPFDLLLLVLVLLLLLLFSNKATIQQL